MLLGALVDCCTSHSDLLFLLGVAADGAQNKIQGNKPGNTEFVLWKRLQSSIWCTFASV